MKINANYDKIQNSYLFVEIANRVKKYTAAHPGADIIRLGIGDVTRPLAPCVVEAGLKAVAEMGKQETFRGYSPDSQGYEFLRDAISAYYARMGVKVGAEEIHVSDGAKSDCGNIVDLFDSDNTVLIPDPVYPVYLDSNIMSGRNVIFCDATEANDFAPAPDKNVKCDIIYLCSPNNPTGSAFTAPQLKAWVDYANSMGAVIIYDAAYEAFITQPDVPRSIFAIDGARTCAIELCSYSKTAGFTGTRCGYTVVPNELLAASSPRCGRAVSPPSSTAPATYSSAWRRPRTRTRASNRTWRTSRRTARTPSSSPTRSTKWASITRAA